MNSIEYLFNQLWETSKDKLTWHSILQKAKEMHKQEVQNYGAKCCLMTKQKNKWTLEELYNETFVSKGSDETLKDRTCNNSCSVVCGECQIFNISDDCEEVRNWDSFVEQKNKELNNQVPDVRKMVEDDVAPIDWLINQLESHIVLSAHNKLGTNRTGDYRIGLRKAIDFCHQAKEMEAKETLYTEEQFRKAYFKGAADVHDKCTDRTWRGIETKDNQGSE